MTTTNKTSQWFCRRGVCQAGLLGPLLLLSHPVYADRISKVVVYPDRAQVTRTAQVACGDKVQTRFASLPPAADVQSVRAAIDVAGAQVLGLRTETEVLRSPFAKQVEQIDEEIRQIDVELRQLGEKRGRERSVEAVATRYEDVAVAMLGRELVDPPGNPQVVAQLPKAWSLAVDAPLKLRLEHAAGVAQVEKTTRELQKKREELVSRRQRLSAASGQSQLHAEVLVSCPGGADRKAQVELSYFVGGAGFSMEHEARLSDKGTVELKSYATLHQHTGEDWRDAQVVVSTAIPRQNATPPDLVPLRITATERQPPKRLLVSRVEEQVHREASGGLVATTTASTGKPGVALQEQGLSVQFVAPGTADVTGDGTPVRIRIAQAELRGKVGYRTIPKLQPYVFRVADLVNTAGYPLLAGPIDVFRKGQFSARYGLSRVAAGERFELSFGLVDRVKVKRSVLEEISRDRGVFGTSRRVRYGYRYEIESYLPSGEEIELQEHIPVSELDDVKVALDAKATPGYTLNAPDGIVTYKLRLSPGEKRAVELHYYVDAPASLLGE